LHTLTLSQTRGSFFTAFPFPLLRKFQGPAVVILDSFWEGNWFEEVVMLEAVVFLASEVDPDSFKTDSEVDPSSSDSLI
jgi:hypothetical protein